MSAPRGNFKLEGSKSDSIPCFGRGEEPGDPSAGAAANLASLGVGQTSGLPVAGPLAPFWVWTFWPRGHRCGLENPRAEWAERGRRSRGIRSKAAAETSADVGQVSDLTVSAFS